MVPDAVHFALPCGHQVGRSACQTRGVCLHVSRLNPPKPFKLLIVECDRNTRTRLELAFEYDGSSYQLFSAPSGKSALLQLSVVQPDLILLDIMLREDDGWAILKRIRQVSSVPIIVISPVDTPEITIRSLEQGANYCMMLPVSMQELRSRVQVLLRREARLDTPDMHPAARSR